jgi:hypothetical protein
MLKERSSTEHVPDLYCRAKQLEQSLENGQEEEEFVCCMLLF